MTTNPILTALVAFILATLIVVSLTLSFYGYDRNFLENILVEAHGMLLDILVIGIFILWLNRRGKKSLENRRYQEDIDDFRRSKSDEATHRIVGSIKRLNRNGITNIKLHDCYLATADLRGADLRGADLSFADLRDAQLIGADLRDAHLSCADLRDANLFHADLRGAYLIGTQLIGADLSYTNLSGINPREGVTPPRVDLKYPDLTDNILKMAGWFITEQLEQAKSMVGATLPDGTVVTKEAWEEFKKPHGQ